MLHDAEAAKNSMRLLLMAMQANTLNTPGDNNGRYVRVQGISIERMLILTRSDQLVLQDDPNFLPDFNLLPQDLDRMDLEFGLLENYL